MTPQEKAINNFLEIIDDIEKQVYIHGEGLSFKYYSYITGNGKIDYREKAGIVNRLIREGYINGKEQEENTSSFTISTTINDLNRARRNIDPVSTFVNSLSESTTPFAILVISGIIQSVELGLEEDKTSYSLQSPSGPILVLERNFLKKLEGYKLLENKGEDGIFGIVRLTNIKLNMLKMIVNKLQKSPKQTIETNTNENTLIPNSHPEKHELKSDKNIKWPPDFTWNDDYGFSFTHKEKQYNYSFDRQKENNKRLEIFKKLCEGKGEYVKLQSISRQINNIPLVDIRSAINQIETKLKEKHIPIKLNASGNSSYRIEFV